MKRILFIGSGDIALRCARQLESRYRLYGLLRSAQRGDQLRQSNITPVAGDLDQYDSLQRLGGAGQLCDSPGATTPHRVM
jgi:saccharopine dehydrogenase-like NADP-dependent oxidoreductase